MSTRSSAQRSSAVAASLPRPQTTAGPRTFLLSLGGRLTLVGAFAALLVLTQSYAWPATTAVLVLTSLLPQHRRIILAAAAAGVVYFVPPVNLELMAALSAERGAGHWVPGWPLVVVGVVAFACTYVEVVRRFPKSLPGRRPVLLLIVLLTALLIVTAHAPLYGSTWFVVTASSMALGSYVWFFAYAASESKLRGAPPALAQVGYWRPFWGFSNVPLGKGAAYLDRVEARDAEQLALAQLGGLRLMAWAAVWFFALEGLREVLYVPREPVGGSVGLLLSWLPPDGMPAIDHVVERQLRGDPYPLATRWAVVVSEFAISILYMAAWGHTIIATCRMAGFNAAPNTDRPLLATSVADFFNRYYFYFKELLAAFFFFPTYLRFFKSRPRLRLFVATVAAAGAGNFLFHFYRDSHEIYRVGFIDALIGYHVYAAYASVLGVGIGISQLRLMARHGRHPTGAHRVIATAGVILFYCLLNVLDVGKAHTIFDYGSFYVSLFWP